MHRISEIGALHLTSHGRSLGIMLNFSSEQLPKKATRQRIDGPTWLLTQQNLWGRSRHVTITCVVSERRRARRHLGVHRTRPARWLRSGVGRLHRGWLLL